MKRVLVIGTSHSEATCQRTPGNEIERMTTGRWHDYFKEHDCEVTSLARAGCTVQQQFLAAHSYLQDHPAERWDLAIVEGRSLETNITIPASTGFTHPNKRAYSHNYNRWTTSTTHGGPMQLDNADSYKIENWPEWQSYYVDYVFSFQHAIDTWSCNYALCSLLSTVAPVVKWFTMSQALEFDKDPTLRQVLVGEDIMKPFLFDNGWPCVTGTGLPEHECACGHMNEIGHELFWKNEIYPRIKQYI